MIHLLQGDNLLWLSVLENALSESVDCVYLDPPYNTNSPDLAYLDTRSPTGPVTWTHFMQPRLFHAHKMLRKDGVLFVCIDDNEQATLRLLLDSIFRKDNFVAQFIWHKTNKGKGISRLARVVTQYVMCYAKDKDTLKRAGGLHGTPPRTDGYTPLGHRPNKENSLRFPVDCLTTPLPNGQYPAGRYGDPTDSLSLLVEDAFTVADGAILTPFFARGRFRWVQRMVDAEYANGTAFGLMCGRHAKQNPPTGTDLADWPLRLVHYRVSTHKAPSTLLNAAACGVGTHEEGTAEVAALLGQVPFLYPQPVSLVRYLVDSVVRHRPHARVVDFFAGTGTTGHAVVDLNKRDNTTRTCILVQDNSRKLGGCVVENAGTSGICTAITLPRLIALQNTHTFDLRHWDGLSDHTALSESDNLKKLVRMLSVAYTKSDVADKADTSTPA